MGLDWSASNAAGSRSATTKAKRHTVNHLMRLTFLRPVSKETSTVVEPLLLLAKSGIFNRYHELFILCLAFISSSDFVLFFFFKSLEQKFSLISRSGRPGG